MMPTHATDPAFLFSELVFLLTSEWILLIPEHSSVPVLREEKKGQALQELVPAETSRMAL